MTKQLFPGVSEQDMKNKEKQKQAKLEQDRKKAEEIKRAAEELKLKAEQEKQRQNLKKKADFLYLRFGEFRKTLDKEIRKFIGRQAILLGVFYTMFGIGSFGDHEDDKGINLFVPAVSKTDIEAAEAHYKGRYSLDEQELEKTDFRKSLWAYITNPVKETYDFSTLFDGDAYKQFVKSLHPSEVRDNGYYIPFVDWRVIRAYVGLIAVILCAAWSVKTVKEDKTAKTKHIREILTAWEQNDFKKLDGFMHTVFSSDGVDVMKLAAKIIQHLSKKDQTVFEKLITGDVKVSVETAVAVMEGHLKSHPEDMELVMSTFDERSIPEEVMAMYNKQQNSKR